MCADTKLEGFRVRSVSAHCAKNKESGKKRVKEVTNLKIFFIHSVFFLVCPDGPPMRF